ncbi:Aspartyl/glutamyl-tRNA(Asn/Gln) amidotransferase subunit B [Frankliniella fusca]|uniref:Aspartyl/glutamyl-tRNA(Asn/Gln) amidotransferase subunit B n=1 Tax=Frankliniella fusca TaxID=407009 RepID=A0AAE1HH67_9NEOP|nr:Aspartyl/glutamyl-tRNA(Asn/Gln) amidotransferase subunit B [Frankliniella fusca]
MQLLGLPSWLPWETTPQCPPLATPTAIAPVTLLDLASSSDFWYWAGEILSHRALYLQIAVALVLVLLVLGLLNICSIQAELLLGRRSKKQAEGAPLPERLAGGLAGLDALPCMHYHKHWAEVVESKFDWRCKKLEDKWNRAAPLLTNLDGRMRRLEGEAGDSQHAHPGYPPPDKLDKARLDSARYSLLKRPASPRARHHGLDNLPSCTETLSTSAPASATPSASPSLEAQTHCPPHPGPPPLLCAHLVDRRSSSLDLSAAPSTAAGTAPGCRGGRAWSRPFKRAGQQRAEAADQAQGQAQLQARDTGGRAGPSQRGQILLLGSKDLQLKYESPSWRSGADAPLPLPPRPKSCPDSKVLADLHQTIDESQMTIPTEGEAGFSLDAADSSDHASSLGDCGQDPDEMSRESYQKSLHRLGRREREAERRARAACDSLLDGDLPAAAAASPVLGELRAFRAGIVPGAGDTKSAYDSGFMSGESSSRGG